MKTKAEKFRKKPHDVYSAASKGDVVVINHDRYREQVFELTARDRYKGNSEDNQEDTEI